MSWIPLPCDEVARSVGLTTTNSPHSSGSRRVPGSSCTVRGTGTSAAFRRLSCSSLGMGPPWNTLPRSGRNPVKATWRKHQGRPCRRLASRIAVGKVGAHDKRLKSRVDVTGVARDCLKVGGRLPAWGVHQNEVTMDRPRPLPVQPQRAAPQQLFPVRQPLCCRSRLPFRLHELSGGSASAQGR